MKTNRLTFIFCFTFFSVGCSVAKFTGDAIVTTGKIAGACGKVTVQAIKTTGNIVTATAKGIATVVQIPGGKKKVKLTQRGNTLFVNAVLNQKVNANLILDTGCADSQISSRIAAKLGIDRSHGQSIQCVLAGGNVVTGRIVNIREVRLGSVKAYNVKAVLLDQDNTTESDGLLGMSFLNNFTFKIDTKNQELILEKHS